jgi:murein hydrolase activator
MRFVFIILVFSNLFIGFNLSGQSRTELERQRRESLEQLELTNKLLKSTETSRRATTQKVNLINQRIRIRQGLIESINREIRLLDERIVENELLIRELTEDLKNAREEYGRIIYYSYKFRNNSNKLIYILASENINQAYRRIKYFQQIGQYRKRQIQAIYGLSQRITEGIIELQNERNDKINLLRVQRNETIALNQERGSFNREVNQLSKRERELREEIRRQQRISQQLEKAIKDLIAEEARKAAERKEIGLTPAERIISEDFRNNRGGLPWPTEKGVIIGFFGENPHPVLRGIKIQNNGVDILTTEGSLARSIFKGEVRKVINIPGMNRGLIIRHGNFLTVYTNLSEVFVNVGDIVEIKQNIGRIYTDRSDGNRTILHLEIWEENKTLDPILWISR